MFTGEDGGLDLQRCPHLHFLPIVTACKANSLLEIFLGCSVANGSTEQAALKPEGVRSHHTPSSAPSYRSYPGGQKAFAPLL